MLMLFSTAITAHDFEVDGIYYKITDDAAHTVYCTTGNIYALSAANNKTNRITNSLTALPYRAYFKSRAACHTHRGGRHHRRKKKRCQVGQFVKKIEGCSFVIH